MKIPKCQKRQISLRQIQSCDKIDVSAPFHKGKFFHKCWTMNGLPKTSKSLQIALNPIEQSLF